MMSKKGIGCSYLMGASWMFHLADSVREVIDEGSSC